MLDVSLHRISATNVADCEKDVRALVLGSAAYEPQFFSYRHKSSSFFYFLRAFSQLNDVNAANNDVTAASRTLLFFRSPLRFSHDPLPVSLPLSLSLFEKPGWIKQAARRAKLFSPNQAPPISVPVTQFRLSNQMNDKMIESRIWSLGEEQMQFLQRTMQYLMIL